LSDFTGTKPQTIGKMALLTKLCSDCGDTIGLTMRKYTFINPENEKLILCKNCYKKRLENTYAVRDNHITSLLKNYLGKCGETTRSAIAILHNTTDLFLKIEDYSLENVNHYINDEITSYRKAIVKLKGNEFKDALNIIETYEVLLVFLVDFEKLYKILKHKNIDTNYVELILKLHDLMGYEVTKKSPSALHPEFVRISNTLKGDLSPRKIIKEFLMSPIEIDYSPALCDLLLKEFNITCDNQELEKLYKELAEEIELEEFEQNLGEKTNKVDLPNFTQMGGGEFEDFLKKLFEALKYTVVQTKISGDQGADLVLLKDNIKTAVQAKKYTGNVSNSAIQEVVAAKAHYLCEKAIVVTTGEFTKSAKELAISNKVELWDKDKLLEVLNQINNTKSISNTSNATSPSTFDNLPLSCPYCHSMMKIPIEDFSYKGELYKLKCPECGVGLSFVPPDEWYSCPFCKDEFILAKDCRQHILICEEGKNRHHICNYCDREFALDDEEYNDLKVNGEIEIHCNGCNNKNLFFIKDK
jgi:restriction system protein